MLRVWQMLTPSSFRRPVWREVALTMAVAALLDQKPRVCLLILLQFHGLLRPGEARHVRWADLGLLAYDSPPLAVRFMLGDRTSLAALQPLDVAVAAALEDTFAPSAHGMIWPSASDLCRRAPGPLVTSEVFVQFSDLGPQFALQGDIITEGFVTAEELEELGDDDLPLVQSSAPPPARGRGRGAAAGASPRPRVRGRATSADPGVSSARGSRGRGRVVPGQVPDGGGGLSAPPKALLDAISSTIRSELGSFTQRIELLEHSHKAPPQAPSLSRGGPPGLDPLFGRGPGLVPDVLSAAREAQQLLRFGAGGSSVPNPFAMPAVGSPKSRPKGPPAKAGGPVKASQGVSGTRRSLLR